MVTKVNDYNIFGICKDFIEAKPENRYLFGINEVSKIIASKIEVAGFPDAALVLSTLFARPLTARAVLSGSKFRYIDFFSFHYFLV